MSNSKIFLTSLAGLGPLLFGIKTITRGLASIAGSRLRSVIAKVTAHPALAKIEAGDIWKTPRV